jgi:hypothetical protein
VIGIRHTAGLRKLPHIFKRKTRKLTALPSNTEWFFKKENVRKKQIGQRKKEKEEVKSEI